MPDYGGDVGIASPILALSAVGFRTFSTSCRGHVGSLDWSIPFVALIADAAHLELLDPLATRAHCAILVRSDGLVEVRAEQVMALNDLAFMLLDHAAAFDALEPIEFEED